MVSIIIVNFNTAALTQDCLASILEHVPAGERELIVVDNASSDRSVEIIHSAFGRQVRVIVNSANLGFAAANNIGARAAHGEYLLFLNSDTVLTVDIISPMIQALHDHPDLNIVAPLLRQDDGREQPYAYGYFPNLWSLISQKLGSVRRPKTVGNLEYVDWVSGAALFIRRSSFEKIGGWDEKYFLYFEDLDLCWQVKKSGGVVAAMKNISLIHLGGRSLDGNRQRKQPYYQAQAYFFKKNYGPASSLALKIIRAPYKMISRFKK